MTVAADVTSVKVLSGGIFSSTRMNPTELQKIARAAKISKVLFCSVLINFEKLNAFSVKRDSEQLNFSLDEDRKWAKISKSWDKLGIQNWISETN